MAAPLMPKATAVWLVDNTSLTFDQIADFCALHRLEVQGIADGEVAIGIQGIDPIANSQLTRDEIERCEKDSSARLKMLKLDLPEPSKRTKGPRYTPVAKRQDKPDAIAWLLRHHPELKESQIAKLIGTTKTTIQAGERAHPLEQPEHSSPRSGFIGPLRAKRVERGGGPGKEARRTARRADPPAGRIRRARPNNRSRPRRAAASAFSIVTVPALSPSRPPQ